MNTFLSADEITALTGKKRKPAQIAALRSMGVQHIVRADGFPVILRNHIEKRLDGIGQSQARQRTQPNWDNV